MGTRRGLGNFVRIALVGVPISVAFLDCVAYVAKVDGISMQPALNPEDGSKTKDFVLLNRWSVKDFNVTRGDIVSLASPRDPELKIIKRVIGLEGDTIKTMGYKQRYVQVPQGHCWVEGDHHKHSMDSNYFGPVALGLITARASHIVWPPARWQRLDTKLPSDRAPTPIKSDPPKPDVFQVPGRPLDEAEDLDSVEHYLSSLWADAPPSS